MGDFDGVPSVFKMLHNPDAGFCSSWLTFGGEATGFFDHSVKGKDGVVRVSLKKKKHIDCVGENRKRILLLWCKRY